MGGCATKPKNIKADADAPPPVDAPDPTPEVAVEKEAVERDQGTPTEENRRRSLGVLFKENEENEVPTSSTDKTIVAETIKEPTVEMEVMSEPSIEHEPNPDITEISNAIKEEVSVPSPKAITTYDKPAAEVQVTAKLSKEHEPNPEITEVSNPIEEVYSPSPMAITTDDKPAADMEVAAEPSKEHEPDVQITEASNPIKGEVSVPSPKAIMVDEKPTAEIIAEPADEPEVVEPSKKHEPNAEITIVSNPVYEEVSVPSLQAIAIDDTKTEISIKEAEVDSSSDVRQGEDVSEKKVVDA